MTFRSVDYQLVTEISGQCVLQISRREAVFFDCLILEDGTNKLSRNLGN
jgi:hypothetical protein